VQALRYSEASADRVLASEAAEFADTLLTIDVLSFTQYVEAVGRQDSELAEFFYQRSREELRVALNAWLTTNPLENPEAPPHPFAMSEYHRAAADQAAELHAQSEAKTEEAKKATHHADRYILLTVLFASSLFFAGLGNVFAARTVKMLTLAMGVILLLFTTAMMATLPIH
jgi:hypothetical protein